MESMMNTWVHYVVSIIAVVSAVLIVIAMRRDGKRDE